MSGEAGYLSPASPPVPLVLCISLIGPGRVATVCVGFNVCSCACAVCVCGVYVRACGVCMRSRVLGMCVLSAGCMVHAHMSNWCDRPAIIVVRL